jgi:hypothetical protein
MNDLIDLDSKSLSAVVGGKAAKHTTNGEFLKSARGCWELPITDAVARLQCYDKAAGRRWELF